MDRKTTKKKKRKEVEESKKKRKEVGFMSKLTGIYQKGETMIIIAPQIKNVRKVCCAIPKGEKAFENNFDVD